MTAKNNPLTIFSGAFKKGEYLLEICVVYVDTGDQREITEGGIVCDFIAISSAFFPPAT